MSDTTTEHRAITVREALRHIGSRAYLLPAIQRRFVWSNERIEALFDSLMQGYPINSFMLWSITAADVKREVRFYDFLQHYRQYFKEKNEHVATQGRDDFFAVIDGQQRLTALYIGLLGTYADKLPRVWWKDTEEALPTRRLYLNLVERRAAEDEQGMVYDFRFLTAAEAPAKGAQSPWFRVGDILDFDTPGKLDEHMDEHGPRDKTARRTLRRLRDVVHRDEAINQYVVSSQDIDTVLDIFIRTNSGGVPLAYSDLLMSYATAQWKQLDARAEFDRLVEQVARIGSPGFMITKDFILKTCLVLFSTSVRFKLGNLKSSVVDELESNWEEVARAIRASFDFLADLGFNELNLRGKVPVIPIVQYVYLRGIAADLAKPQTHASDRSAMRTWLCMSILRGVFRYQSDHLLTTLRKLVRAGAEASPPRFPLDEIRSEFSADQTRSLELTDDFIEQILRTEIGDSTALPLLTLLYSHLDYSRQRIDIDHLHPAAEIGRLKQLPEDRRPVDWEFIVDPANWNSVANLQPLNDSLNRSKQDRSLREWVEEKKIERATYLLPADVSLDISAFREFIEARRVLLGKRLREVVKGS